MKKYDLKDGVWRTIGGRRVFIKNGQDLKSAMKESGKFEKQKIRTTAQINKEYEELSKKMQKDDYYYRPEDDRKLKELRAEYDTEVARGQEDVNYTAYKNKEKEFHYAGEELYSDDPNRFGDKSRKINEKMYQEQLESAKRVEERYNKENKVKTGNDYLPKESKILTAGTSNRKEVSDNIQAHILSYYDNPVDFMEQMDAMDYLPTRWRQGEEIAKGGSYLIYNGDMSEYLNKLNINPKGKKFSEDKSFQMYTSLIGRESERLYNRLEKLYEQYKKEHKNSNVTLDDFRKWFK